MGRLFLDTNIYIAALKEEKVEANSLLERALGCEFEINYNSLVEAEITLKYPHIIPDFEILLTELEQEGKLVTVPLNARDRMEALRLMRDLKFQQADLGYEDCAYGILARKYRCVLVSEDRKLVENMRNYKINARRLSFFFRPSVY